MLSLQLKDGEYLTIGEEIVVQVFASSTVRVSVQAPRDLTILRGEVLERNGADRPVCLYGQTPKKVETPQKVSTG